MKKLLTMIEYVKNGLQSFMLSNASGSRKPVDRLIFNCMSTPLGLFNA